MTGSEPLLAAALETAQRPQVARGTDASCLLMMTTDLPWRTIMHPLPLASYQSISAKGKNG